MNGYPCNEFCAIISGHRDFLSETCLGKNKVLEGERSGHMRFEYCEEEDGDSHLNTTIVRHCVRPRTASLLCLLMLGENVDNMEVEEPVVVLAHVPPKARTTE